MTVTVEANRHVALPVAEPGEQFDVQVSPDNAKIILTRLDPQRPAPTFVRIEKRDGFSVGVLNHPIDDHALKEALAEFP